MSVPNDTQSPEEYARAIRDTLDAYHAGKLTYGQVFDITSTLWRKVLARGLTDQVTSALAGMQRAHLLSKPR